MTYTFVTLVSLLTINVLVPVFCRLSQCNLAVSNRVIKSRQWPSFGKIDKRDLVEYFVTYINDDNERVTFDRTNTTNTPRFQPMRWFNINEKIGDILPMIYDYYFSITRYFMNIQTIHIDLNVTPEDCIYSIDYEEVEILTRKFFIGHVSIVDSHICSANIVDKNGIGVVSYNCCRVVESSNETVCSDINEDFDWLTGVNIVAIVASILIMGMIFMLILLSPTGTEEFYFYPTNMVIDYTAGESTNNDGSRNAAGESTNNDGSRNAAGESTNNDGSRNAAGESTNNDGSRNAAGESTNNDGSRNAAGENTNNDSSRNASGESTNNDGSIKASGESTNNDGSRNAAGESTNNDSSRNAAGESTNNDSSRNAAGESTNNDSSRNASGEITNNDSSRNAAGESTNNDGSIKASGESTNNDGSIKASGESTNNDSSRNAAGESTNNDSSRNAAGESTNNDSSRNASGESTNNDSSRNAAGESTNNDGSIKASGESTNNDGSIKASGESTNNDGSIKASGESTNNDGSRNASGKSTNNDGSRNASGESTNKAGSMNAASNETKIRIRVFETCNRKETFQRKTGTSNKNEVIIDKLKILLTKKQCVDNNYSAITFFRCITEFLTGLDSSYCKPSKNLNKCFFSCDCCSDKPMCLPLVRLYLGKVLFLVFSIIFFVPTCYLLYKTKNNNMLCSELEVKGLSCPFSDETASFCFYVLSFFYCAVIALYFFPCNNFITMLIPELPWSEYDKSDTFRYPRGCEIVKIIVSLLSMAVVFTTWGFFLYFLITLLLRILIMSSSTRNILDDFSFVIFPLFLVVYDYITNVTKEFKVISENIFDLVRNDDELKCSSINSKKKLNEAILLSGEDQTIEGSLTYVGKELRLNINCPFIFQRRDGRMYTSKRLVTQIYNDSSEFLPFELSAYLKAFLVSLVPCALYAIVFMVFVTYTSIISYSTHVAGYTATALTGLKWLHSKVGSLIQEILISNKSVKQSVKERLKQERLNFHESWKVSAIHFKGD